MSHHNTQQLSLIELGNASRKDLMQLFHTGQAPKVGLFNGEYMAMFPMAESSKDKYTQGI